ncbi:alpha beta-hydrolase [Suillus ampliporus]|nr:alpha beta-hydrolase [Suillus ampliporus]
MLLTQLVLGWATFWGFGPTVPPDNAAVTDVASGFSSLPAVAVLHRWPRVTVTGNYLPLLNINQWLGIPYAEPPTGDRRLRRPERITVYNESFNANEFGPTCYQHTTQPPVTHMAEDCLTLNVITPGWDIQRPFKGYPVIIWIYGGGFESGDTAMYDGSLLVSRSIGWEVPVVFVSMNYRMSAFGFLGSKEVQEANVGNLGLHDQRVAMEWVQQYIDAFGGDPTRVTLWGQSAGGVSIGLHMLANGGDTKGLFHAAWMQSGFPLSLGNITRGQADYDFMVNATNCTDSPHTLDCLRTVKYETFIDAIKTPPFLEYGGMPPNWLPRVDGDLLTDNPYNLIANGSIANIPFIVTDCDDEGTLFSLAASLQIHDIAQLQDYIHTYWYPDAPPAIAQTALDHYSTNVTQGSPFDTGYKNVLTEHFKRLAAIQGDLVTQAPRRFLLEHLSDRQNAWSMLIKRFKWTPFLGSTFLLGVAWRHVSFALRLTVTRMADLDLDILDLFWPKWTVDSPNIIAYLDGLPTQVIEQDTYRADAIRYLNEENWNYPL